MFEGFNKLCDFIDGCILCKFEKIVYIDEFDFNDLVVICLVCICLFCDGIVLWFEVEWVGDGVVLV